MFNDIMCNFEGINKNCRKILHSENWGKKQYDKRKLRAIILVNGDKFY